MLAAADKLQLSEIASSVVQSEIRAMSIACAAMGGVNLAQGVCDTPTPEVVQQAAQAAIRAGHNIYTRMDGIDPLRHAIAAKLERENGLDYRATGEVVVTAGATGAFYAACMALLNPGDEVVMFEPFYGYHYNTLRAMRVKTVMIELELPGFAFDMERVAKAITPRTKAILINTPANPAGKVFTRAEIDGLAELARRHELFVITDEIYEYFMYDGAKHLSPASIEGMRDRTITISGFSKTFSVTGWRVGYLAADERWAGPIAHLHDLAYICAPSPLQAGCAAGMKELPASYYAALASDYLVKRDKICAALSDAGLTPYVPRGAYYVLADASRVTGATAKEKALELLRVSGVATVPGSAFFTQGRGENLLRFCFAKTETDLERACSALRTMQL
jgi:aminotransferase